MPNISENGMVSFSSFNRLPGLICIFTTKIWDKKNSVSTHEDRIQKLAKYLKITRSQIQLMRQKHGIGIENVIPDSGFIPECDGLLSQKPNTFIAVQTADCVPVFFYENITHTTGVLHGGWRGISKGIIKEFIKKWNSLHLSLKDTYLVIGPHIGGCCYTIDNERAEIFSKLGFDRAMYQAEGIRHLDLGIIVRDQLIGYGISGKNIETPINCTSCQNDVFYSLRKDKILKGKMIGLMGSKA